MQNAKPRSTGPGKRRSYLLQVREYSTQRSCSEV
jgi:hypothetical protein